MQLLFFLARGTSALPFPQKLSAMRRGLPLRASYLSYGLTAHATRLHLTPFVVYVQKLSRLIRAAPGGATAVEGGELILFYMAAECEEGAISPGCLDMLRTLYAMRALILLIDGVDEAADLAPLVEEFVTTRLVPGGHPLVVTSRPEGVRLSRYAADFVIINLEPLSSRQQQAAIDMQLQVRRTGPSVWSAALRRT